MDRSPCSLDAEFSDQIAELLSSPSPQSIEGYYSELIEKTKCHGITVKHSKDLGKGVFANMEFKEGQLILKDQILVASQHSSNKVDCFVCGHCFRFIGSIELQIGRKLYLQHLGLSVTEKCGHETRSDTSEEDSSTELLDEDENFVTQNGDNVGSSSSNHSKQSSLSKEILESLMDGDYSLPYTKEFVLPPVIACPGGCEEEHYCSKLCADSDWESFHSLLCTGERVQSSRRAALLNFLEHANRTNDIFILAAKVISLTILKYKRLKGLDGTDESNFQLLLEAWKPISMGHKPRWWDCIALPDDVSICNEASFRMQIRDLAFTSLQLLKEAIFDKECAPLFSLEIYGHIVGMFELNNLDLVVASPVEDYFIYIDDLPSPEKEEAEKQTRSFLDALDDEYSECCQGQRWTSNNNCTPTHLHRRRDYGFIY